MWGGAWPVRSVGSTRWCACWARVRVRRPRCRWGGKCGDVPSERAVGARVLSGDRRPVDVVVGDLHLGAGLPAVGSETDLRDAVAAGELGAVAPATHRQNLGSAAALAAIVSSWLSEPRAPSLEAASSNSSRSASARNSTSIGSPSSSSIRGRSRPRSRTSARRGNRNKGQPPVTAGRRCEPHRPKRTTLRAHHPA